ncbi:MAG: L-serine ammonia-lyase, iron-sulfur-dependent subunit beta [Synergistaceae bacterium]|nr:L-serine ammonia-lyase, iron-sulfur-dependent subunit beta [Synergistaceae bacterium]MBR1604165.1 L-serine ammonia-lyase, iron-sulfur-dependent subunit beta [Synergistaceae bacterium]
MNIFDIIGPVMIGPSSSHTAGAVRLGRVANKIMNIKSIDALRGLKLEIILSGSFARTYKGHGTDRALLAGVMGYHSYSSEIRDALEIAKSQGIDYKFIEQDIKGAHPNTARINFELGNSSGYIQGASIGGGNIRVDLVNGMRVDFTGENNTILVMHWDRPGVIADVTSLMRLKYPNANIANFKLSRKERGGEALMTIELDNRRDAADERGMAADIQGLNNVINAIVIRAI